MFSFFSVPTAARSRFITLSLCDCGLRTVARLTYRASPTPLSRAHPTINHHEQDYDSEINATPTTDGRTNVDAKKELPFFLPRRPLLTGMCE